MEKFEELIQSPDSDSRIFAAEHGYGWDVLIRDPEPDVRLAVAMQGYKLDILVKDDDENVRDAAKYMLNMENR